MKKLFSRNKTVVFRWLIVSTLFLLITWLHMGASLTHCSTTVLGKPGDHTAGIMYGSWVNPTSPILGQTSFTNYPFGENLWLPTSLSSIVPSTIHLLFSHITNIVCAWNLLILLGYMSTALVMFGFMFWLTKNSFAAFFAAYAVTYTPYHAFASWGQPAGLFGAIFILAFWQFIDLWKKPSANKGVRLGAILGFGFYTDGYFILLGSTMLAVFWLASIVYKLIFARTQSTNFKQILKSLAVTSITALIFLLPLAWVNYHDSSQINSYLGNTRGDIKYDAQTYSARPYMYLMPTEQAPIVGKHVASFQTKYFNESAQPGLIFLGYSVILLAIYGCWSLWRKHIKNPKIAIHNDPALVAGLTALILAILAAWVSLRPKTYLFGFSIYNPSALIISVTSSWRVFGRLYALVAIGCAILAGIGLANLMQKFPSRRLLIFGVCTLALVFELRMFPVSSVVKTFNYEKAPKIYRTLKETPQVKAIAEYPLDEPPQGAFLGSYYTFQEISNKPMLNTFLPNSPQSSLRRSIAGINDPQTIPVLRALGVGLVNVRPVSLAKNSVDLRPAARLNPELKMVLSDKRMEYPIDSFLINPGRRASYALILPDLHYYQIDLRPNGSADYLVGSNTAISIIQLPGATGKRDQTRVAFDIKADSTRATTIKQNGAVVWKGEVSQNNQTISFDASTKNSFVIYSQESSTPLQLYISRLQVID